MINARLLLIKLRYLFLIFLAFIITWQLYQNYSRRHQQEDRRDRDHDSDNILKTIKQLENKAQVTVSVYYEALCPDSRNFFSLHLLRTYSQMQNALKIELIPYGKAKTEKLDDGRFIFECQHGAVECFANKIHSCAIHYISKFSLLLRYITCMIENNEDPEGIGQECARRYNVQWLPILECAKSKQGDYLLKKYGEMTDNLTSPISFVPTVLLNQNLHSQALILKDLKKELCLHYRDLLSNECEKIA